jgi:phage terminase large subunit
MIRTGSKLTIPVARAFQPLVDRSRYKGAFGGRGSGKSHFFAGKMISDAIREPGDSGSGLLGVCVREVQKVSKGIGQAAY